MSHRLRQNESCGLTKIAGEPEKNAYVGTNWMPINTGIRLTEFRRFDEYQAKHIRDSFFDAQLRPVGATGCTNRKLLNCRGRFHLRAQRRAAKLRR